MQNSSSIDSPAVSSILHVITCLDVGGAELALKRLILADPQAASRHMVVSLRDIGQVGRELQAEGVAVQALHMNPARPNIAAFFRLVQFIIRRRPSVIQTWMYHSDFFGGLAARCAGRRELIWGIRNTGFAPEASRVTKLLMRLCARMSSWLPRVIICCAEAARVAHVEWGYHAPAMRVIPNGFVLPDLSRLAEWRQSMRAEIGAPPDSVVVGMVARFDPLKNHLGFIDSAGILARTHKNVSFMLVGRGVDSNNEQLLQWIEATGCKERFILLGERRDMERCFAAMDVFCLSSIHEAFPNVVAEAMAMSLPCVVTDAGDAARIVAESGWVAPKGDQSSLVQALEAAVACDELQRQSIGRAARERIESNFSMAATRQQFEAAYLDAVAEGSR